jgi:hypothetical protein
LLKVLPVSGGASATKKKNLTFPCPTPTRLRLDGRTVRRTTGFTIKPFFLCFSFLFGCGFFPADPELVAFGDGYAVRGLLGNSAFSILRVEGFCLGVLSPGLVCSGFRALPAGWGPSARRRHWNLPLHFALIPAGHVLQRRWKLDQRCHALLLPGTGMKASFLRLSQLRKKGRFLRRGVRRHLPTCLNSQTGAGSSAFTKQAAITVPRLACQATFGTLPLFTSSVGASAVLFLLSWLQTALRGG